MSAKLYDYDNEQWVEVPDDRVTEVVSKGTHGFQEGMDIPVVAADGSHGSIKAETAAEMFASGNFRWRTMSDAYETEAVETAAQEKERFDNASMAVNAWGTGAAGGYTYGITDAAMRGTAELMGKGEEYTSARQKMEQHNPGAYMAGKVMGTIASPITKALGPGEKAIEQFVVNPLGRGVVQTGAAKVFQTVVKKGLSNAYSGAVMGLGEGISEASIGDPKDAGEKIFANVANGLIWGAATGPLFAGGEAAAPYVKQGLQKTYDAAADVAGSTARGVVGSIIAPVLSLKGEKEVAALVSRLSTKPSAKVRELWMSGDREGARRLAAEIEPLEAELAEQLGRQKDEIAEGIKGAPGEAQEKIRAAYDEAQGSVYETSAALEAAHKGKKIELDGALASDVMPSSNFHAIQNETRATIARLREVGDFKSKQLAKQMEDVLQAKEAAYAGGTQLTEGVELQIAADMRGRAITRMKGQSEEAQKIISAYEKRMTRHLHSHPAHGPAFQEMDKLDEAYKVFQNAVGGSRKNGAVSFIQDLVNDPRAAAKFAKVAQSLSEVAPHIENVVKAGENIKAREEALDLLMSRAREVKGSKLHELTVDDWDDLVREFGTPDMSQKVARLRELEGAMASNGSNAAERAIQMKRALGHDVTPDLKRLAENDKAYSALKRLEQLGVQADEDLAKSLIVRAGRRGGQVLGGIVGGKIGFMAGPLVGSLAAAAGSAKGGQWGASLAGSVKKATNPSRIISTLTWVEGAAKKSADRLDKYTKRAVDALTSETGRRAAQATGTFGVDFVHKKEDYKRVVANVEKLHDPQVLAEFAAEKFSTLEGAPMLQAHLTEQLGRTVQYINARRPHDPLQSMMINPLMSKWEPSDHELSKFGRIVSASMDPAYVLERVAKGTALPEEIETLQIVHPGTFQRLQADVMDAIMDPNVKLSYAQRIQIGNLLNIPADATLDPKFIQSMQANYDIDQGGRPPSQGAAAQSSQAIPRPAQMNVAADAMSTQVQRTTEKQ